MNGAGPSGPFQSRFEDGLRFLGVALALQEDGRLGAAALSAACDALRCFLGILDEAARRHFPDPEGEVRRLGEQARALLSLSQDASEAAPHALEAARLARDQAARVLPRLL